MPSLFELVELVRRKALLIESSHGCGCYSAMNAEGAVVHVCGPCVQRGLLELERSTRAERESELELFAQPDPWPFGDGDVPPRPAS